MPRRTTPRDPAETLAIVQELRERHIPPETRAAVAAAFQRAVARPPEPESFSDAERREAADILAAIRRRHAPDGA